MCCRLKVSSCTTGGCTAWSPPYRVAVPPATPTVHRLDSGPGGRVGTTGSVTLLQLAAVQPSPLSMMWQSSLPHPQYTGWTAVLAVG